MNRSCGSRVVNQNYHGPGYESPLLGDHFRVDLNSSFSFVRPGVDEFAIRACGRSFETLLLVLREMACIMYNYNRERSINTCNTRNYSFERN
jgi:hypothetical protein